MYAFTSAKEMKNVFRLLLISAMDGDKNENENNESNDNLNENGDIIISRFRFALSEIPTKN